MWKVLTDKELEALELEKLRFLNQKISNVRAGVIHNGKITYLTKGADTMTNAAKLKDMKEQLELARREYRQIIRTDLEERHGTFERRPVEIQDRLDLIDDEIDRMVENIFEAAHHERMQSLCK